MKPGRGSLTAERVAERRAAHQVLDTPRVFEDPLAISLIGPDAAHRLREGRPDRSPLSDYLRAFVSMRSRFAEDALARAYEHGIRQYVIVGAGFDTFAYRNPYPDLHVFEVDHPDTQAVKRKLLADANITVPRELTFVEADLAREPLGERLAASGFDAARPAFVAWLGVSMYLSLPDVRRTLQTLGSLAPRTSLVLDYAVPPGSINWFARLFYRAMLRRVASIGEPWMTFFEPEDLERELVAANFAVQENLGPEDINARYFADRTDGLKVSEAGRIARALIETPPSAGSGIRIDDSE